MVWYDFGLILVFRWVVLRCSSGGGAGCWWLLLLLRAMNVGGKIENLTIVVSCGERK